MAADWGWELQDDGRWRTAAQQMVKPGYTSLAWIDHLAEESWRQWMWHKDTKTEFVDTARRPAQAFQPHAAVQWDAEDRYLNRVMAGAAVDARMLQEKGAARPCACGEAVPTREHVTFFCQADESGLEAATALERRLLLRLLPAPALSRCGGAALDDDLVRAMRSQRKVVVGTDGGCFQSPNYPLYQRAVWALALRDGPCVGGEVFFAEATAAAGEREAFYVTALHLHAAEASEAVVYTDSKALVSRVARERRGVQGGAAPGLWAEIMRLLPADTSVVWVPAHDGHATWQPESGPLSAREARELNRRADARATEELSRWAATFRSGEEERKAATSWSKRAIERQAAATREYHTEWCRLCAGEGLADYVRPGGEGARPSGAEEAPPA
jgi:ribonuclease HI